MWMQSIRKILTISTFALLPLSSSNVIAAAAIQFDSLTYHMGTVFEGTVDSLRHEFVFKNTGADTLRIDNIKPG
jgi:hypothetical protein